MLIVHASVVAELSELFLNSNSNHLPHNEIPVMSDQILRFILVLKEIHNLSKKADHRLGSVDLIAKII